MSTVTVNYAASSALTISPETVASSATFVAGVESAVVDNTTDKYVDALLSGKITVGTTPTINTQILVYVFGMVDDSEYPDAMDGTASAETITSAGVGRGFLKLAAVLDVDATTSDRTYAFGPVSVAMLFGGVLPKKWGVFITHNTGVNTNTTAGNHEVHMVGVKY